MTHELFEILNKIPPPGISGRFKMDGELDPGARELAPSRGTKIYASCRLPELYVAVRSSQPRRTSTHVFIAGRPGVFDEPGPGGPGPLRTGPGSSGGLVAAWHDSLELELSEASARWRDRSGEVLRCCSGAAVGTVIEGAVDIELLLGIVPRQVFVAAGQYSTAGALVAQVPAGNGDPNIDAAEFAAISCK